VADGLSDSEPSRAERRSATGERGPFRKPASEFIGCWVLNSPLNRACFDGHHWGKAGGHWPLGRFGAAVAVWHDSCIRIDARGAADRRIRPAPPATDPADRSRRFDARPEVLEQLQTAANSARIRPGHGAAVAAREIGHGRPLFSETNFDAGRQRRPLEGKDHVDTQVETRPVSRIRSALFLPSAALCISRNQIRYYSRLDKPPRAGDLVYGKVKYVGFHSTLENKQGRIHVINHGSRAAFVFGSRYAPDAYEGIVPDTLGREADMLARSGMIGLVRQKNLNVKDPTRIEVLGYICDSEGRVINTRDFPLTKDPKRRTKGRRRAKLILVVGTSMNSGKSVTAASICWALATMGHKVRGSKVTGTASLKDILRMEDAGASPVSDFTHFGYPSTYLLDEGQLLEIFNKLDLKYANNPSNYWVVEIADGILQRETAMLLGCEAIRRRIHRLIFAAHDALGAVAGVQILDARFGLKPDAISGLCSASPLAIQELSGFTDIPVISNTQRDLNQWSKIVL